MNFGLQSFQEKTREQESSVGEQSKLSISLLKHVFILSYFILLFFKELMFMLASFIKCMLLLTGGWLINSPIEILPNNQLIYKNDL